MDSPVVAPPAASAGRPVPPTPTPLVKRRWVQVAAGLGAAAVLLGVCTAGAGADANQAFAEQVCRIDRPLTVTERQEWAFRAADAAAQSVSGDIDPNKVYAACSAMLNVSTDPGFDGDGDGIGDGTITTAPDVVRQAAGGGFALELPGWLAKWQSSRSASDWEDFYAPAIAFYATDEDLEHNSLFSPDDLDTMVEGFAAGRLRPDAERFAVQITKTYCAMIRDVGWSGITDRIATNYANDPGAFPFLTIEDAIEYYLVSGKVLCPDQEPEAGSDGAGPAPAAPDGDPPADVPATPIDRFVARIEGDLNYGSASPVTVTCPSSARGEPGDVVICTAQGDPALVDDATVWILVLGENDYIAYDVGTGIPASVAELGPDGLFCRDLVARDVSYFYATAYWLAHGSPARMDADNNGIPCETVYPSQDPDRVWGHGE